MAKSLLWCDLTEHHLEHFDKPGFDRIASETQLMKLLSLPNHATDLRQGILMDLFINTLQFSKEKHFSAEKASTFFSIVKVNHYKAIGERLTIERSFKFFKSLLLQHSVQRPPYSVGIFSLEDVKSTTEYMINSYYRHYKLYQYTFTKKFTLDLAPKPPLVKVSPVLPGLNDALHTEKWKLHQAELQRQEEEKKAEEERLAAEKLEADRQEALKREYVEAIPEVIHEKVHSVLEQKMAEMKANVEETFAKQEENLLAKIAELEGKQA